MDEFDLDLRAIEDRIDDATEEESSERPDDVGVELGILDGSTPSDEWLAAIDKGHILVLSIAGDLNELAAGFAREVYDSGGELVHFRGFLIVTPPGVAVDTGRLNEES